MAKINALKNKMSTSIESIRIEFNRVTGSNLNSVIENIKKVQVEKVEEMKLVSAFVFEKIISEPLYADLYIFIVGQLKASAWKCEEEKAMTEKSQTCFFGTLMNFAKQRLETENDWYAEVDMNALDRGSRAELEKQIEERISEKIKKKQHALGNVYFLISLYLKNITGLPNVVMVIERLLSRNTPEHIIMLCFVYRPLMEKLVNMNRTDLAARIVEYLKANEKTPELRLQIEIEKALKFNPLGTTAKQTPRNSFAGILSVDADEPKKSDSEVLQGYISDVAGAVATLADDEEVAEYAERVYKNVDRFDNHAFFLAYLVETIANYKQFHRLVTILLNKLLPKAIDLGAVLKDLKEEMHMLCIDVACASKNYAELLCLLRAKDKIQQSDFDNLKLPQFIKHAMPLLKKWKENGDSRLAIVATDEEIHKINEF